MVAKLENLFGEGPWDQAKVQAYLATMHNARPFMPPVPGSDEELGALTTYLCALTDQPAPLTGAQQTGVVAPR